MFTEWQLTSWECTSSQHSKWVKEVKEGQIFNHHTTSNLENTKYVDSKVTYLLREQQLTTQQVGKESKRSKFLLIIQNPILSMQKDAHSKATYRLTVHQLTTQQVGKEGKRNNFSLITQNPILSMHAQTCSFRDNLPAKSASVHNTASG